MMKYKNLTGLSIQYKEVINELIALKDYSVHIEVVDKQYPFDSKFDQWNVLDAMFDKHTSKGTGLFPTLVTLQNDIVFMLGATSDHPHLTIMFSFGELHSLMNENGRGICINGPSYISAHTALRTLTDIIR